ncbi:hypothetical protein [Pseudomonas sp.]|uniref:hypothetical protein n=1 Tax=Pseudomonas sp. TaxID=306 RepID=UPI0012DA6522
MKQIVKPKATEGAGMSIKDYENCQVNCMQKDRETLLSMIIDKAVLKISDTSIPRRKTDEYQLKLIKESTIDESSLLAVDYLSGVFASSSALGNTGSTAEIFIKDVLGLTELDLKLHKLIYEYISNITVDGNNFDIPFKQEMSTPSILLSDVLSGMDKSDTHESFAIENTQGSLERLKRSKLIDDYIAIDGTKLEVQTSKKGIQLLFWSKGNGVLV